MGIHAFFERHPKLCSKIPGVILNLRFFKRSGRFFQNPPRGFYDKIIWMSLHSDTGFWSQLSDKYAVRKYVAEKCGERYLTKLYGVYDCASDIDFDLLPDKYVIKTNNGCGTNIFVHSKNEENRQEIVDKLESWLTYPYGAVTGQKHYSRIVPKIIAEELLYQNEFLHAGLVDYKFYCFNGVPAYCQTMCDRTMDSDRTHKYKEMLYDLNWKPVQNAFRNTFKLKDIDKPSKFSEMIEVAKNLSSGIKFVRVDLYQINNEVKFGEMTFMPGFGMEFSETFQTYMGNMIEL